MKQNTGFLVALALLVIVAGVVAYLAMEDQKAPASSPPPETRVFTDNLKGLSAATLKRPGEETIRLLRTAPPTETGAGIGEWSIESPGRYKVDVMMLGEWIGALRTLDAERALPLPEAESPEFGLSAPMLSIGLTEGEKTRTLTIGAMNPEGSARYAKLAGVPKLYLLAVGSVSTLNKSLGELRQKRVFDTTEFAAESIRIVAPSGEREIVRTPSRDWTFARPANFRADPSLMGEFVNALLSARAEAAAMDRAPVATPLFRAMAPVASVTVATSTGALHAEFRRNKGEDICASSSDLGGVYPVQTDIENFLKKPIEEFRNLKLFGFGFSDVFTLRYQADGRTLDLRHPSEEWLREGKAVDAAAVNKLLDELRGLSGSTFVEGAAPGSVLATVDVETAGGLKDHVEFRAHGAERFAVRGGEAGYYKVSDGVLADIGKAASGIAGSAGTP